MQAVHGLRNPVAICAGGTGGHLFPAEALSAELKKRGYQIILLTDDRGLRYGDRFPCDDIAQIPSSTLSPRAPIKAIVGLVKICLGVIKSWRILRSSRACAIAGFGGYPSLPPMLAGRLLGLPACLHEQNAVMGRANRFLARFADVLALSFDNTQKTPVAGKLRIITTGNPVRNQVLALAGSTYVPAVEGEEFRLLVFGGSQGAKIFSDIVPQALNLLSELTKKRLKVTQQCRSEDINTVKSAYKTAGIDTEVASFFSDLPERIAKSHLVLARSGASTLSELTVIGRPSVLVPLPGSLDNDQRENARALEEVGGAWIIEQSDFKPDFLAHMLDTFLSEPDLLVKAATAAHQNGKPDSVKYLADAIEEIACMNEDK